MQPHSQPQSTALYSSSLSALVEITHPFHPLRGKRFVLVKSHKQPKKDVLRLKIEESVTINIPREWTSLADPEPFPEGSKEALVLSPFNLKQLFKLIQSLKESCD